ncbi:MAG: MFS transporter [Acidimicrobiales bacterium]|jgi:MFS family permease
MTTAEVVPMRDDERDAVQQRTIRVLQGGVVPGGMAMTCAFVAAALVGEDMTGSKAWGVIAGVALSIGGTIATIPLAQVMSRLGRRPGLRAGYGAGFVGSVASFLAILTDFYPLLLFGMLLVGAGQSSNLAARFAGADLASDDTKARSIGRVMWGGTVGSVLGPVFSLNVASPALEALGFKQYAGSFFASMVLFAIAAYTIHRFLRPDPLKVAGGDGKMPSVRPPAMRDLRFIATNYRPFLAVSGMGLGQAVMVGIMAVTSLHLRDGVQSEAMIPFVISLHIIGMYAFSPYVGKLVDSVGPNLVIAMGAIQLLIGAEVASHTDAEHAMGHFVGLFLVGTGWSFAVVAGSALLTASTPLEQRVGVQATADFIMTLTGAAAGITSGIIVESRSYHDLAHWAGFLAIALTILALGGIVLALRKPQATPAPS